MSDVTTEGESDDPGGPVPGDWSPTLVGQEWANALTHGVATLVALVALGVLVSEASGTYPAMVIGCLAYGSTVVGTFAASTLSHAVHRQPWLDTFRTWDQAMIYLMIAGTYTPIVIEYAPGHIAGPLLWVMWLAAAMGFGHKIFWRHRINAAGTISYLLLGWLPAIPLQGHVPQRMIFAMALGGVIYTVGVIFLVNDRRVRYFHAAWHLSVILAAGIHFHAIRSQIVAAW